jgi:hypothetical protein
MALSHTACTFRQSYPHRCKCTPLHTDLCRHVLISWDGSSTSSSPLSAAITKDHAASTEQSSSGSSIEPITDHHAPEQTLASGFEYFCRPGLGRVRPQLERVHRDGLKAELLRHWNTFTNV